MRFTIILSISFVLGSCQPQKQPPIKPKIVVGIVVDQMKQEYLLRFYDKYGERGFKRLISEGFQFRNAHYNYVPTYTAPGHASIYTGTTPSNHGIIANAWYSREKDRSIYCVSDPEMNAVGGSKSNGMISPKNLIASTVTDELRVISNFRSKVVGVSLKDRGAVLPAGHNPTGAYWFDDKTGNFMTSDYYFEDLPQWVKDFNEQKLVSKYLEGTWSTLLPIEEYSESTPDDTPYERIPKGKGTPTFPYNLSELVVDNGIGMIRTTPFGNTLIADFAIAAIEGESMGEDEFVDLLAVSFSSPDYIGHAFGPNSIEVEDNYLRLDKEIERLLDYLDDRFGNAYQVFLTADHGVAAVPQFQIDNKMPGGYINTQQTAEDFERLVEQQLGKSEWILDVSNSQLFLDRELIKARDLNLADMQEQLVDIALQLPSVQQAYAASEIAKRSGSGHYRVLLENGYNQQRSGDVLVHLSPGYLRGRDGGRGTTHGSGGTYDTHIPIIFFGANIPNGSSVRKVAITDIAPTISMLLNISLPSSCTGIPLQEVFQ